MRQGVLGLLIALVLVALLGEPRSAPAITILFEATDLADSGGGDLWQYTYQVSGFTPQENTAFEIFFDPDLYRDLQDPPPAVPDWDIITIQPDPAIPDDGIYSALALLDNASLAGPFTIEFVWLGPPGTVPGSQPFELNAFVLNDVTGDLEFSRTLDDGRTTTTAVPESATLVLLGTGLACLLGCRKLGQRR